MIIVFEIYQPSTWPQDFELAISVVWNSLSSICMTHFLTSCPSSLIKYFIKKGFSYYPNLNSNSIQSQPTLPPPHTPFTPTMLFSLPLNINLTSADILHITYYQPFPLEYKFYVCKKYFDCCFPAPRRVPDNKVGFQ